MVVSCTNEQPQREEIKPVQDEWVLTWSDEFNGNEIDRTKWNFEIGDDIRNNESQYYTARNTNARIENGSLIIEAHKEKYNGADYTSASLLTRGLHSFWYGRIEMRAKLPHGAGTWPAFWTTGTNYINVGWPECGEIDIMEYLGRMPGIIHGTVHYTSNTGTHISQGGNKTINDPQEFKTYSIEWDEDHIKFFVNDINYYSFDIGNNEAFRKPHILRLNFALGGWWGKEIDDSMLPQKYIIDYVRVYSRTVGSYTNLVGVYRLLLLDKT
jgi:beta-glucanase (GH16 family)